MASLAAHPRGLTDWLVCVSLTPRTATGMPPIMQGTTGDGSCDILMFSSVWIILYPWFQIEARAPLWQHHGANNLHGDIGPMRYDVSPALSVSMKVKISSRFQLKLVPDVRRLGGISELGDGGCTA